MQNTGRTARAKTRSTAKSGRLHEIVEQSRRRRHRASVGRHLGGRGYWFAFWFEPPNARPERPPARGMPKVPLPKARLVSQRPIHIVDLLAERARKGRQAVGACDTSCPVVCHLRAGLTVFIRMAPVLFHSEVGPNVRCRKTPVPLKWITKAHDVPI